MSLSLNPSNRRWGICVCAVEMYTAVVDVCSGVVEGARARFARAAEVE